MTIRSVQFAKKVYKTLQKSIVGHLNIYKSTQKVKDITFTNVITFSFITVIFEQ